MKAKLFTKGGDFVDGVDMPFFLTPPDVVVWGERMFVHTPMKGNAEKWNKLKWVATYKEAFAWHVSPRYPVPEK